MSDSTFKWSLLIPLFVMVSLISGCMVGPDFVKPDAPVEEEWLHQQDSKIKSEPADFSDWWTVFDDLLLNKLIELASQQNLNLLNAGLRILEGRHQWRHHLRRAPVSQRHGHIP